jgi:MFS family permease
VNEPPPEVREAETLYHGWWIVIASSVFNTLFGGLYHTGMSVYFLPLIREFNLTYTKLSLAFSLRTLEGGIEGPVAGWLVDRLGPRMVIFAGVIIGGVGFVLLSQVQSFAMFLAVFLSLLTVGFSVPFHGIAASINLWFRRRLGIAMSLASAGSAFGGFVLTPFVAWLVLNQSWRLAAIGSGIVLLLIGPVLALLMRRPHPHEADRDEFPVPPADHQPSDPLSTADKSDEHHRRQLVGISSTDFTISQALHTATYWLLALAIGLRLVAQSALTVHMVPMLVSRDVGEGMAAALVSVNAFIRLPTMIGAGFLADQWSRTKISAVAMVAGAVAAATIAWGPGGIVTGVAFVVLFATAQASNSVTWALVGQFFGRKNFGSLRGGVTMVQSLMSTGGPLVAGWIRDRTGSYTIAFFWIGVIYLLSALLFWRLKRPEEPNGPEDSGSVQGTASRTSPPT